MRTSKNRKIFLADNEQGTMKRGQKWFPEKLLKILDLENFRSESFSIRTPEGRAPASELVLQRGSLPFEVYRGVSADFEKPGTRIFTLGLHYSCIPSRVLHSPPRGGGIAPP